MLKILNAFKFEFDVIIYILFLLRGTKIKFLVSFSPQNDHI